MMSDYLIAYPPNGAVVRERATGRHGVIVGTRQLGLLVEWNEHPLTLQPTFKGWQSWHGYGAIELVS